MRYGMYWGCSLGTEYDKYKLGIVNELPASWEIFLYCSKKPDLSLITHPRVRILPIYDHPAFARRLSEEEIASCERWLGYPFALFMQSNYNLDKPFSKKTERRHQELLAQLVMAYRDLFKATRISAFSSGLESGYTEIVCSHVAKRMGIRVIHAFAGRLTNTFSVNGPDFNAIWWNKPSAGEIEEGYRRVVGMISGTWRVNPHILEENKARMGMGVLGLARKAWAYWRLHASAHPIERERYHPVSRLIYDFLLQKFRALLFSRFFFKKPDLSQRFFYFPLHFEQDAQLTTREPFVEQVQLIRNISFCLPVGVKLYVKSHPHYLASDMEYRRIREISRLPNVVLIDPSAYSTEIVKHAIGVITVNSTVGFEAMALDRPVITFGHDFYAIPGACIVLRDMADLPAALMGVMRNPHYGIDPRIRKRFIGLYACNIIQLEGKLLWGGFDFTKNDYRRIAQMLQAALRTPEAPYGLPPENGKKSKASAKNRSAIQG